MFGIYAIAFKSAIWESSAKSRTSELRSQFSAVTTVLFVSFALALSGPVKAEIILYGTSTGFGSGGGQGGSGGPGSGTGGGNFSQFHRIDITTGVANEISADIGYGGDVGGLAADANNVLFAGTGGRGPNTLGRGESPTLLFTINPVDGLGSIPEIGPLGIEFGPPDSAGQGPGVGDFEQFGSRRQNISGWSFDPVSGDLYGMAARGSQLFIADTTTGIATRIGAACDSPIIGMPGGQCRRGNAIAFDDVGINNPLGTLFWGNDVDIAELDPTTGMIIGIPVELDFTPFGIPTDPNAPFRVVAMDFHPMTGELYAAVQQGQAESNPPPNSTLAILDPNTGTFTIIGAVDSTGVKLDGIAFTSEVVFYGTSTGFGSGGGQGGSGGPGSGTGGGNFSQFHRIDVNTGVTAEISMNIGYGGDVGGLAADTNSILFAGTGGRGPNTLGRGESPTLLFTINPVDGLGSIPEIGPLGIEFGPPDSAGQGPGAGDFEQFGSRRQNISGWSFDPVSGDLYGMAARGSQLFIADTATGIATRIGTPCDSPVIGMPGGQCRRGNAIAFDDVGISNTLGTLFWANDVEVAELDPATGLIVGPPTFLDYNPFGIPNDQNAPFRVVAMDFHPLTGDLYTAVQQGQAETNPPPKSTIAILDPDTGTFTIVGAVDSTDVKLDGIAFSHPDTVTISVEIDIKPGSDRNSVNPRSKGVIPVAILTTDTFDATTVNPATVQFGPDGAGIKHKSGHFEDVDDDGDTDLVLHFPTRESGIKCGDTDASLSGATFDETPIAGSDSVSTVGCSKQAPPSLTFTPDVWTLSLDAEGPGVHSIFMIADVSPLTPNDLQDLGGRLVWFDTEIELCADPTYPPDDEGTFISIREVGNGFLKIGDGFETDFQGEGCAINSAMQTAFDTFGLPNEACLSVRTGDVDFEYCAPLAVQFTNVTTTGIAICDDFGGAGDFGCRIVPPGAPEDLHLTVIDGSASINIEIEGTQHIELIDTDNDLETIAFAVEVTNTGANSAMVFMNMMLTDQNGQMIGPDFPVAPFPVPAGFSGLVAFTAGFPIENISPIVYHGMRIEMDVEEGPIIFGDFIQANIFEVDQTSNVQN